MSGAANTDGARWRPMTPDDIGDVARIGNSIHLDYPEEREVFAERQRLYPDGCKMLTMGGRPVGYILTHPWHYLSPPTLNTPLGAIPEKPTTYYIHDLALLPETRGSGAGSVIVSEILAHAASQGFTNVSLIAVKESPAFWRKHGFELVTDPKLVAKLGTYDDAARYMVKPL